MFIEVNLHWTHYTHPFNATCIEDLTQLETFRTKNTKGDGSVSYTEPICVTDDTSDGYIIVLSRENQTIYCDANGNPI